MRRSIDLTSEIYKLSSEDKILSSLIKKRRFHALF